MKKVYFAMITLFICAATFIGCQKEEIKNGAKPVAAYGPSATPECCLHFHYHGPDHSAKYACCLCDFCSEGGISTHPDSLTANDVINGAAVQYCNEDWSSAYEFYTDSLGHWSDIDDPISAGTYNVIFTKSGYVSDTVIGVEYSSFGHASIQVELQKQ